jgi:uncharacterized protein YjbI with pentapeptide repeats
MRIFLGADLSGTKLDTVDLTDANFTNAIFDSKTSFKNSKLTRTKISKKALQKAGISLGPKQTFDYNNLTSE